MMNLFINALAASAGGGLTYVRNVVPHFAEHDTVRITVLLSPMLRAQLASYHNVSFIEHEPASGVISRIWFEQRRLPDLIRQARAEVLLSAGNFALANSPVPQILLSRNALYTSSDFQQDLRSRGDYALWLDTELKARIARWSIRHAAATVAPSRAFADELRDWTGVEVKVIHHGFNREAFLANQAPLPEPVRRALDVTEGALRLLFVSHYNYYRNFETLLRALPLLREKLAPRRVCLILTCKLRSDANPGSYLAGSASDLVRQLGVSPNVIELGSVPYDLLHHLYRVCDMYLTAAYAESFAHPLVEAMSSGLPVVASDLPVHREICGDAAMYFPRFSYSSLAERVIELAGSPALMEGFSERALRRARDFSWKKHANEVLALAFRLSEAPETSD
jgi:glycosyltransferase involved in cell wall biosynthesis